MSRIRSVLRLGLVALFCHACGSAPVGQLRQAEIDTFSLGTGRDGNALFSGSNQIINTYAPITGVPTTNSVTIGTERGLAGGFAAGHVVMVWRTTGYTPAPASGTQTALDVSSDATGYYEYARIETATPTTLTFTNPLAQPSQFTSGSQVVRVPEYTGVTFVALSSISGSAWDGSSGGIVTFFATGTVTGIGTVNMNGLGFRGGVAENFSGSAGCTMLDGPTLTGGAANGGAHKGEGLVPTAFSISTYPTAPNTAYGYGNVSHGGGGGNCWNSGGGGGGHGGKGGKGADWTGDSRMVGGLGGVALTYSLTDHILMGGGGGSGEENNNVGSAGAPGGGAILVRANQISGGNYQANGSSAAGSSNDGAGGGGAGGAIALFATASVSCTSAQVQGGAGGNAGSGHGNGAGGAGGKFYAGAGTMVSCTPSLTGGAGGTNAGGSLAGGAGGIGVSATGSFTGTACDSTAIGNNTCGGCLVNSDCPMALPLCDTTKHSCGTCTAANQTACSGSTPLCNTTPTNNVCAGCNADFGGMGPLACPVQQMPVCNTSGPLAGQCTVCSSTNVTLCTGVNGACRLSNGTCDKCDSDFGGSGMVACAMATPFCKVDGSCSTSCSTDAQCGMGKWCNDVTAAGVCQNIVANGMPVPGGTCNAMVGSRGCTSGVCDTGANVCGLNTGSGTCTVNTQCNIAGDHCITSGANMGKCYPCNGNSDCSGTVCNTATNLCVGCTASDTSLCSGSTPTCDTVTFTCKACTADNSAAASQACPSSSNPYCNTDGTCGKCTATSDCAITTGTHGTITRGGPFCDTVGGACSTTCTNDQDCMNDQFCDTGVGQCKPKLPVGGSCTMPSQCLSGFCVANLCATTDMGTPDMTAVADMTQTGDMTKLDGGSGDMTQTTGDMTQTGDIAASADLRNTDALPPIDDFAIGNDLTSSGGSFMGGGLTCSYQPHTAPQQSSGMALVMLGVIISLTGVRYRRRQRG